MNRNRPYFRTVRIVLLLIVGAGAFFLLRWNRQYDPRFYRFLGSAPGQMLSRIFNWTGDTVEFVDVPLSEMTPDEQATMQRLQAQLQREIVSDIVTKTNGQEIKGEIVSETPTSVTIVQKFGDSGGMKFSLKRTDIERIERVDASVPEITYRDVRFQMEFPGMNLYRRPPYTILTSEKYFDVQGAVRTLEYLHEDFVGTFGELMNTNERGKSIQLLFFSHEDDFTRYRKKHAPSLGYSAGFYSPDIDRFVIYDQKESGQMDAASIELERMYKEYRETYKTQGNLTSIQHWYDEQKRNLSRMAGEENGRVLRHEGAHQLFYTYGVHSQHHAENLWLIEGLAVFCETDPVGRTVTASKAVLVAAEENGRVIPMKKLVNYRSPQGFGRLVRDGEIDIAYAQSWALVHYLMDTRRRPAFFKYLSTIRDVENTSAISKADRLQTLCECIGETPASLTKNVMAHLHSL